MLKSPLHPYTKGLMDAIPTITETRQRIEGIRGVTPSPDNWPQGCRFHDRCKYAMPKCKEIMPLLLPPRADQVEALNGIETSSEERKVACVLYDREGDERELAND